MGVPNAREVAAGEELLARVLADAKARLGREPTALELHGWGMAYRHVGIRLEEMAKGKLGRDRTEGGGAP